MECRLGLVAGDGGDRWRDSTIANMAVGGDDAVLVDVGKRRGEEGRVTYGTASVEMFFMESPR